MEIIDELIDLCSSEKIREFRSYPKKVYKHYLAGILNDILFENSINKSLNYHQALFMSMTPQSHPNSEGPGYIKIKKNIVTKLENNNFITPERDSQLDLVIAFLRQYLNELKGNDKTLYLVSDFTKIVRVKRYFWENQGLILQNHHWLDITLTKPVTPTFPEFFNYQDLINLWNDYIYKYNDYKKILEENGSENSPKFRELNYSIKGSERTLIVLATNFVESYLYYYFYNIKSSGKFSGNKVMNIKGYIQDTQIVEDLIFEEHEDLRNDENIQDLYVIFKETLKVRDRFVHTSAFVDGSNKIAELQPLLNINRDNVIKYLQNSIDLVSRVDSMLPEDEKILFWWERFENPIFSKFEYINPLNVYR